MEIVESMVEGSMVVDSKESIIVDISVEIDGVVFMVEGSMDEDSMVVESM